MGEFSVDRAKRRFLKISAVAPVTAFAIHPASAETRSGPVVETGNGKVRGQTHDGIHSFKGIPYGADTSGPHRFMPPQRPSPWTGVRDAIAWGNVAPQRVGNPSEYSRLVDWTNLPGGQGENCLVLNVWTPGARTGKRPVLFSIHGGGFSTGTSGNPVFDGSHLAKMADVVVVTINHRLGSLGYLHLADLHPDFAMSGVAGMLDCVAALEWVRDNIAVFGGDPGKVMIFGQSGGGSKVSHLLAMPAAKGLFHRAAMQSGVALRTRSREDGTAAAEALLARLGVAKSDVRKLQELPFEKIIEAQTGQIGPVMDGVAVPRHPFDPDAPAVSASVPLLVGSCLHDSAFNLPNLAMTEAEMLEHARKLIGSSAEKLVSEYRSLDLKSSPSLLMARMTTDRGLRRNAITLAERKHAQGAAAVFMYRLDWPSPAYNGKFGAVHGTDVPLSFHNVDAWPITGSGPEARAMARRMASAWVAFARTGNPNSREVPRWPAYTPTDRATMIFDSATKVVNRPDEQLLALFG